MKFSAFVVDDEPKALSNIVHALQMHKNWQEVHAYSSGELLVSDAQLLKPNVVFLDIKMPGDNGLALARQLLKLVHPPIIVFVTAFADYAVDAFELYAMDYLLKPFSDGRISTCIKKLEYELLNDAIHQNALQRQHAWANNKPVDKIVIKSSNVLRVIPTAHIYWLAANGNYVDIHHEDGKHLLRGSLKSVMGTLPSEDFIQIHRGIVVRITLVRELKSLNDDQYSILLATGEVLPVGKSFHSNIIKCLYN